MKFFLDQHGCAKNSVDGEVLASLLVDAGWDFCSDANAADLIIVNSCGFIESAKTESINAAIMARAAYPNAKIVMAGCLAERYRDDIFNGMPEVNGVFGNGDLSKIAGFARKIMSGERSCETFPQKSVPCVQRRIFLSRKNSAFVKVSEGCDNRCSFCAIPLIRGGHRSRTADEVAAEIAALVGKSFREINLVGQDLASFGAETGDDHALIRLLERIDGIAGDFAIRLLYIHPDRFPLEILPAIRASKHVVPYFDIPFQSASKRILAAMNRRGDADVYLRLVEKIAEQLPDFSLRTTFLTGFPGETEEDFAETLAFLRRLRPLWSGAFAFSREDGTPAAAMKGRVAKKIAEARKKILEDEQAEITEDLLCGRVGKIFDVLVEETLPPQNDGDGGIAIGRTWFQAPDVDGVTVVRCDADDGGIPSEGDVVKVKIDGVRDVNLAGTLVSARGEM